MPVPTFEECLRTSIKNHELIKEYDRLNNTNLSFAGHNIELLIDRSAKRQELEISGFADFVHEYIYKPLFQKEFTHPRPKPLCHKRG